MMYALRQLIIALVEALFRGKTTPRTNVTPELEQSFIHPPIDVKTGPKWHAPIREDKFKLTQTFLNPDPVTYPKTGVHCGVDYGTNGETDVPMYYVCDGEVIDRGLLHKSFGNFFFYYVPSVDRTFVYFHLKESPPLIGTYYSGEVAGTVGQTGLSYGIHLHLECLKGKKTSADRGQLFTSLDNVKLHSEDADKFIRNML